jgi:hypothetical protein
MNNEEPYDQVEPVYEKLAPGEVLIISKEGNCITYVTNDQGEVVLTRGSRFEESVLARR